MTEVVSMPRRKTVELKAFGERGSGKTTALQVCREALVKAGFEVTKLDGDRESLIMTRKGN